MRNPNVRTERRLAKYFLGKITNIRVSGKKASKPGNEEPVALKKTEDGKIRSLPKFNNCFHERCLESIEVDLRYNRCELREETNK